MSKYEVRVRFMMAATTTIEANSEDEAVKLALDVPEDLINEAEIEDSFLDWVDKVED